ncbi:MAG: hypothetical protein ACLQVD_02360 [Capsulimonadaceae bacterium]
MASYTTTSANSSDSASLLGRAARIAATAHEGQFDKAGRTYILHPIRLMTKASTDDERIVALLHDVVEDGEGWTLDRLRAEGFPDHIVATVDCLTARDGESYPDFISRVLENQLAIRVKLLDIEDNLDLTRLPEFGVEDAARVEKYHAAYRRLKAALD